MIKAYNIAKKIAPTCISLCLALCLVFSSLSSYTFEIFFNANSNHTEISVAQLEQGYIHHTNPSKSNFLAEVIDIEEENDKNTHKKNLNITFAKILRILWSYSFIKQESIQSVDYSEFFTVKITEPCYIKYCSLKIPSLA